MESTASAAHWAAEREPASTLLGPICPPRTTSGLLPDRGQLTSHDLSCTFYADETSAALWSNSRLLRVVSKADWALPVNGSQPGTWTVWRSRRCGFATSGHVASSAPAASPTSLSPVSAPLGLATCSVATTVQPWSGRSMRTIGPVPGQGSRNAASAGDSAGENTWGRKINTCWGCCEEPD